MAFFGGSDILKKDDQLTIALPWSVAGSVQPAPGSAGAPLTGCLIETRLRVWGLHLQTHPV